MWIVDPATSAVCAADHDRGYETDRVIVAAGLRPGDLVVTRNAQKMSKPEGRHRGGAPAMKTSWISC